MVRQDARDGVAAVLRCRLPSRLRSVDFRRRDKLGDHGAIGGVTGAAVTGIGRTIEITTNPPRKSAERLVIGWLGCLVYPR